MMRVLEFIVALIIVAVVGLIAGIAMPSSGHIERTQTIGKDMRQVYDILDNFRRFPDYSALSAYDRQIKYDFSGPAYGPGAEIAWTSYNDKVGDGKLSIVSADPSFQKIDSTVRDATIVWNLENNWRGTDKHFTIQLERAGHENKLTKVTWTYDVKYGWNLISRFSNLYIHGAPDSFIQFNLSNLQNVLATVANVDYGKLDPVIVQSKPIPVLSVSTGSARKDGDDALNDAVTKATTVLQGDAKKLGVTATGPVIVVERNFGDTNVQYDVLLPISSSTLNVGGQSQQLTALAMPKPGAAPAAASTAATPASSVATPGSRDSQGRLVIDSDVTAELFGGGAVLQANASGTVALVWQLMPQELKAFAQTHGYHYDDVNAPVYYVKTQSGDGTNTFDQYVVSLPITDAPAQTPEQAAGIKSSSAPAASGTAPAPAVSTAK